MPDLIIEISIFKVTLYSTALFEVMRRCIVNESNLREIRGTSLLEFGSTTCSYDVAMGASRSS